MKQIVDDFNICLKLCRNDNGECSFVLNYQIIVIE